MNLAPYYYFFGASDHTGGQNEQLANWYQLTFSADFWALKKNPVEVKAAALSQDASPDEAARYGAV